MMARLGPRHRRDRDDGRPRAAMSTASTHGREASRLPSETWYGASNIDGSHAGVQNFTQELPRKLLPPGAKEASRAAVNHRTVGSSCVELPREPLGVAGGADRAVESEGFPQRPVGRRRVAERGSQATAQLQDSRRQRPTLD